MAELVHKCIDDAFMKLLEGDMKEAAEYFECAEKENPENIHILLELIECVLHSWRNVKINLLL